MVRPEAAHSVVVGASAPLRVSGASMRTDTVLPSASAICDASVRFQMRS
jgi:hypothetical protein